MRRLKEILLILLILGAAMPAAAQPSLFEAIYWFAGTVSDSAPASPNGIANRTIVVTCEGETGSITALTDASGKFMLNVGGFGLKDPAPKYYAAVQQGSDGYGANFKEVLITGQGWETVDFQLEPSVGNSSISGKIYYPAGTELEGANVILTDGTNTWTTISDITGDYTFTALPAGNYSVMAHKYIDPSDVWGSYNGISLGDNDSKTGIDITLRLIPAGIIPLLIMRDTEIKLIWDQAYFGNADIYQLSGTGTGQYSNATGWLPLASDQAGGIYPDTGQVAAGDNERYYKALKTGQDISRIPDAWAVGKVNIILKPGYNLISIPFDYSNSEGSLVSVFGNQLNVGDVSNADRVYEKDVPGSWGMPNAYLSTDGKWYWSNQPGVETTITVKGTSGYLVRVNGSQKTATFVGAVPLQQATVSMLNGYNAIGTVFPISLPLNNLGIYGLANVTAGNANTADRIYIKDQADSWGMPNAYLAGDGMWYWSNQPSVLADFTFNAPRGYFYRMRGSGEILWIRALP